MRLKLLCHTGQIACTRQGDLWYYSSKDRACVAEHRFAAGPAAFISPQRSGVRRVMLTTGAAHWQASCMSNAELEAPIEMQLEEGLCEIQDYLFNGQWTGNTAQCVG